MRVPAFHPPFLAEVLLQEWENYVLPRHDATYMAARPVAVVTLTALLGTLVFRRHSDLAIDLEDIRQTLRQAQTFGLGSATDAGPGRAMRLVPAALAACQQLYLGTPPTKPPVVVLLYIGSHPAAELKIDDISDIIETLQSTLGLGVEIISWHNCVDALPTSAVQLWLLLGYPKS